MIQSKVILLNSLKNFKYFIKNYLASNESFMLSGLKQLDGVNDSSNQFLFEENIKKNNKEISIDLSLISNEVIDNMWYDVVITPNLSYVVREYSLTKDSNQVIKIFKLMLIIISSYISKLV
jgi:hypothetical protein